MNNKNSELVDFARKLLERIIPLCYKEGDMLSEYRQDKQISDRFNMASYTRINMSSKTTFSIMFFFAFLYTSVEAIDMLIPRSHDNWQSIQTDHFQMHYSSDLEEWAIKTALAMESIHCAVTSFIGYNEIEKPIDIIVMDPFGVPNGMAIPFLKTPGIILWPNSPVDPFTLGGLETWSEIVLVHEYAHAVHLTRKPRSIQGKLSSHLLPFGPLAMKLPPWVTEGYAVLIESRLTGYGRSTSSLRASKLSQLAIEGKLPEYHALGDTSEWTGYTFPYLIGSAFLEWLIDKSGDPECLDKLWKRLSAKKNRDFKEAFSGVFQNTPENLYARFRAELTAEGLRLEEYVKETGGIQEGTIWQYFEGMIDGPTMSPDGKEMALVLRSFKEPTKLVIWSTEQVAEKKEDPALKDPEDVPDLPMHPPKRKELHVFTARNGIVPAGPRYMPDGQSILFHALRPKSNGDYRSDIYRWYPKTDHLDRLTHGASLAWIDPCNDGLSAIALKQENGFSGIVKLDLETGEIRNITEFSLETVWHNPKVSPDGRKVATVRRQNNRAELVILDLESDEIMIVPSTDREILFHPAWTTAGDAVIFCSDRSGMINIEMVELATLERTQLTRSVSGVITPILANNQENGMFFLKPHASGTNIHYATLQNMAPFMRPEVDFSYTIPPYRVQKPEPFQSAEMLSNHPYKPLDNLSYNWTTSVIQTQYSSSIQLGIRANDILGRVHAIAMGSMASNGGVKGGMMAFGYRGWPVHVKFKGFLEKEQFEKQKLTGKMHPFLPEQSARGAELVLSRTFRGSNWGFTAESGSAWSQYETDPGVRFDHVSTGLQTSAKIFGNTGNTHYSVECTAMGQTGSTDENSWSRYLMETTATYGWKHTGISVSYTEGKVDREANLFEQFQLGGTLGTIQPGWLHSNRIQAPWYPAGAAIGSQFSKYDLKMILGEGSPLVIYGSEISTRHHEPALLERVIGCEWLADIPYLSILNFAPMEFSLGVAYGLKGEIESKWRGYIATRILI